MEDILMAHQTIALFHEPGGLESAICQLMDEELYDYVLPFLSRPLPLKNGKTGIHFLSDMDTSRFEVVSGHADSAPVVNVEHPWKADADLFVFSDGPTYAPDHPDLQNRILYVGTKHFCMTMLDAHL